MPPHSTRIAKRPTQPAIHRVPLVSYACIFVLPAAFSFSLAWGADFHKEIRPILKERCFACHGALKQEADLRVDTATSILDSGVVTPHNPQESRLLQRIRAHDDAIRMPPEGSPLTTDEAALIERWIAQGAMVPDADEPEDDPRDHWAFRVPVRVPAPRVHGRALSNPIDAFLLHRLEQVGIEPQPIASKEVWIRRVTFDLIGLLPTPNEVEDYLADESPEAMDRVVTRLLNSPQYGERWGRHWMDVWRYADWFGRRSVPDVWNSAPQIWRWRDWIIDSMNADKGYDRMIQEMLAGDELAAGDPSTVVATGYLIRNWYALNPNDWMRSVVEHTNKAFLGLTMQCAHCHDHKYDPIRQDEYFAMRAFFEPMYVRQDRWPGEKDPGPFQDYQYSTQRTVQRLGYVSVFDKSPDAPTWFYSGGDERNRDTTRGPIAPSVPEFLRHTGDETVSAVALPLDAWYPGLHEKDLNTVRQEMQTALDDAKRERDEARKERDLWESHHTFDAERQARLDRCAEAKTALDALENGSPVERSVEPLQGHRSLYFDASAGRSMWMRDVSKLPSLTDGDWIEFRVAILSQAHFNVQLVRNREQGLTATVVAFENGRIESYRPGSFDPLIVVPSPEPASNASDLDPRTSHIRRFHVRMALDRGNDQVRLSIRDLNDDRTLASDVPVALHGWDPALHPEQGLFVDARTGARALLDDLRVVRRDGETILTTDFESVESNGPLATAQSKSTTSPNGEWEPVHSFTQPGAITDVVGSIPHPKYLERLAAWKRAQRLVQREALRCEAAQARVDALEAKRDEWEARVVYERSRCRSDSNPALETPEYQHARNAGSKLRTLEHEWKRRQAEYELAVAENTPQGETSEQMQKVRDAEARLRVAEQLWSEMEQPTSAEFPAAIEPVSRQYPPTSTGRRSALAAWIASPRNPLTARVAVNHIWLRHFHKPLVETVHDFGRNGKPPTHPELLDWLAVELMESNWSLKHLHRLIVTSDAYQRDSSAGENQAAQVDPENRWLWRMNTGRMEAEGLRDSILDIAHQLDGRMHGQELENQQSFTTFRRSLYYSCQPEDDGKSPLGALFDGPDANECYRRTRTVIPQQSLALTNSDWIHTLSQRILEQIDAPNRSNEELIEVAFTRILGRPPRDEEGRVCLEFLDGSNEGERASLIRALLNHHEFITLR